MKKKVFIIWAQGESKVSYFLAKALDFEVITIYKEVKPTFLRYFFQFKKTFKKLNQSQPSFIYVQNPPIFAVLAVFIYAKQNKIGFGIDTHTAGMLKKKWRFFFFLHKFLARRAKLNTFHNYKNLEMVKNWGLPQASELRFYIPQKEELIKEIKLEKNIQEKLTGIEKKIFMVNRFADDDAYQEVIETAKLNPDLIFFITGNFSKISFKNLPANIVLTNFLNYYSFMGLMNECDLVLALTKREDTVLWSIREALALEKPVVLSNTEVLKYYFSDFAIFTDHSPIDINKKIKKALTEQGAIKRKEKLFIEKDRELFAEDIAKIKNIIN